MYTFHYINSRTGMHYSVTGLVYGHYVIHHRDSGIWTLTHIKTGVCLSVLFKHQFYAKRFALMLTTDYDADTLINDDGTMTSNREICREYARTIENMRYATNSLREKPL